MTEPKPPKRKQPLGQSIGGVLFGFEQQILRNQPPPNELVHHARPDDPVPAGNGGFVTIGLPDEAHAAPLSESPPSSSPTQPPIPRRSDAVPDLDLAALGRRPLPAGFPEERPRPPVIAESGDPFAALRVIEAVAQMERGRPARIDDLVDRLNAAYLDWLFTRRVVVDVLVALQSNWMADYRNASGIVLDDGERGPVVTLEDSSRVDPWIVQQAQREVRACREALDAFARRDDPFASG